MCAVLESKKEELRTDVADRLCAGKCPLGARAWSTYMAELRTSIRHQDVSWCKGKYCLTWGETTTGDDSAAATFRIRRSGLFDPYRVVQTPACTITAVEQRNPLELSLQ
jgi:hypothetical protein